MVYQGRKRSRKKRAGAFPVLLWALIIVVAAAAAFPKAAEKVRDRVADAMKLDIGGAMEVFKREVRDESLFKAAKEAFKYAFRPQEDRGIEVLAEGENGGSPVSGEAEAAGKTLSAEESFRASQDIYNDMGLPNNVTYDQKETSLTFTTPAAGEVVRGFGYGKDEDGEVSFHYGIDVKAGSGADVLSPAPGTVEAVGDSTIFGRYVILSHGDGVSSLYAMLEETPLMQGESVRAGQTLGTTAGETVHMELLIDGDYVNPQYYVYQYGEQ